MDEVERLQYIIDQLLITKAEFAKSINVSKDTVYNILARKTKFTANVRGEILKSYPNISRKWFETGEGEVFTWKETPEKKSEIAEDPSKYSGNLIQQLKDKDFIIQEQQRIIVQQRELLDSLLKK